MRESKKIRSDFPGVYFMKHSQRKHGVQADKYFLIRFKIDGKSIEEGIGWASQGHTAREASGILSTLKKNRKLGTGPFTHREMKAENEAESSAKTAKLKAEVEARKTLSEYWADSYLPAAKRSKKENSWEKEEQHYRLWIGPLLGALPIRTIGLKQWDELVKILSKANLSPRMKEYVTGTLRRVLRHAYDRRMIDEAPPTGKRIGVSGPGNNRRLRTLSHDEEAAIMDRLLAEDPYFWRITRFAFLTGCRASEAFNLVWAKVDFSRGRIILTETKNHDSRMLPLTAPLLALFASMQSGAPGDRVFTSAPCFQRRGGCTETERGQNRAGPGSVPLDPAHGSHTACPKTRTA